MPVPHECQQSDAEKRMALFDIKELLLNENGGRALLDGVDPELIEELIEKSKQF